ncbi:acyl-CoA dehydrogenase family protein [Corynebacterium sp. S7]
MTDTHNPLSGAPTDFYNVFSDVSGEDLKAWQDAATFGAEIAPHVNEAWEKAEYRIDLVERAGELDLLLDGIEIPGHRSMSRLAVGLVYMEIARADASMGTALAVQAGLAMQSIDQCGSQAQKDQYLDKMAKGEILGAFALTEPDHGSDSVALETSAVLDGDEWVINGEKKWIGQGSVGHISVVWARMENGEVSGFIVPQDSPGYEAQTIEGKGGLRGIPQAHIKFTDVRVPKENRLEGANSFRDVATVLTGTRSSVAWAALGIAISSFETALSYVKEREQFGKPLAKMQLIQYRLSNMLQDLTAMALYCRRLVTMEMDGTMTEQQASLAKVHNTRKARAITADARDMLGGVGMLLENNVMRNLADIEALHTYEGTDTIQNLIVGKEITGMSAYR